MISLNALPKRGHVFLRQTFGFDGVMQIDRNFCRPQHPVARPVMLERPHQADRHDGNPQLLRHAETAVLKLVHVPVACALRFRKNNQACTLFDGVLRQPPHALQIRRPPYIRNRNVAKALHQPPVRRNLEVRFQLPPAHQLRNRAVQHERIEQIDVVDMKKLVFWSSKPADRRTSTCAPERNAMRRQKLRCNQSCFRGSRKMPRNTSTGTTVKKCNPLKLHKIALRNTSQPRFIYIRPPRRE